MIVLIWLLWLKGYLGDPGATAATVDAEGWIHTGDIGKYDDQHRFFITNRLKELIKYKGSISQVRIKMVKMLYSVM